MAVDPTPEQRHAIMLFATRSDLAVQAGAGTGKTSTGVLLGQHGKANRRRGQYTAFNKAIVEEAKTKFAGLDVEANTAHSIAMRAHGRPYAHRLGSDRMKSWDIAARLRIEPFKIDYGQQVKTMSVTYLAGLAMRTVASFCKTADPDLTDRHVPYVDGIDVPTPDGKRTYANNRELAHHVLPYARMAWRDLSDTQGQFPFRHEHYLKIAQLRGVRLGVDYLFVDECQDLSPVMFDIAMQQTDAQKVWVGDSQQAINGFTGAVDVFQLLDSATNECYLTKSFRFGPAVAEVANGLLERLDATLRLTGHDPVPSRLVDDLARPTCILTRTNGAAVSRMLELIADGLHPHLVGGGGEVIRFAKGAADLIEHGHTAHPDLACFDSWEEVQRYVEEDEQGPELRMLVKLIDTFGYRAVIDALERQPSERKADVVISTAHKSKGREWDHVQLGGDFMPPRDGADDLAPEELRLLYVAVTRARLTLDVHLAPHVLDPKARAEKSDQPPPPRRLSTGQLALL